MRVPARRESPGGWLKSGEGGHGYAPRQESTTVDPSLENCHSPFTVATVALNVALADMPPAENITTEAAFLMSITLVPLTKYGTSVN